MIKEDVTEYFTKALGENQGVKKYFEDILKKPEPGKASQFTRTSIQSLLDKTYQGYLKKFNLPDTTEVYQAFAGELGALFNNNQEIRELLMLTNSSSKIPMLRPDNFKRWLRTEASDITSKAQTDQEVDKAISDIVERFNNSQREAHPDIDTEVGYQYQLLHDILATASNWPVKVQPIVTSKLRDMIFVLRQRRNELMSSVASEKAST